MTFYFLTRSAHENIDIFQYYACIFLTTLCFLFVASIVLDIVP